jgi:superoxide dismutase, Fe-Mn family
MLYTLPDLPYASNALEPYIDARTMEIHHDGHHASYVTNLNKTMEGHELGRLGIEDLLSSIRTLPERIQNSIRNFGGGHANHALFWTIMSPRGGGYPVGELAKDIDKHFGGFDHFRDELSKAALNRFGSGWAWLTLDTEGNLVVETTANQDSPLMHGHAPVLGIDVWEHAYYLRYQNRRADYIKAFFNVIDWNAVTLRYLEAMERMHALHV